MIARRRLTTSQPFALLLSTLYVSPLHENEHKGWCTDVDVGRAEAGQTFPHMPQLLVPAVASSQYEVVQPAGIVLEQVILQAGAAAAPLP